jgi:hypothetical protein
MISSMVDGTNRRRDYTNEIIAVGNSKFKYVDAGSIEVEKKKYKSKKTIIVIPLLVLVIIGLAYIFMYAHKTSRPGSIPKKIKESASFTLYYPTELPPGYSVKQESFSQATAVLTYYAENSHGQKIFFSEQALPDKAAMDDFNSRALQNQTNISTNSGKASIGTLNNRTTGSLTASQTWVLITASDDSARTAITDALRNLKQVY